MREHKIKVYKFDELSAEAQEKALQGMRFWDVEDFEWWEFTYEDAKNVGIKITSFDLDRGNITGEFIESAEYTIDKILMDHGPTCDTYITAHNYKKALEDQKEDDADDFKHEFLNAILEDYRIILQKEFEYLTSDTHLKETIEANEYEFTEDGKLFRA